ncbi:MAG TPA: hypothetical protein VK020_12385 [Microlunatus sp.]|nr:hypothetical protein [Microlunatus sp.]
MSAPSPHDAAELREGTTATRQAVIHCPYCSEETLFPIEGGGWECRSCWRAFSIKFLGLRSPDQGATDR